MSSGAPARLRAEQLLRPLGLGVRRPRFSWWLPAGAETQRGYRLRADNGWDTGLVHSGESVLVPYDGPALQSGQRVVWQVKVWTDLGESGWSAPEPFELGLLDASDWSAAWIGPCEAEPGAPGERPAHRLRASFELGQAQAAAGPARLYATAHGIYEAFLNGERVGDIELAPGFTEYRTRLQVQTYDVGTALRVGTNVLELVVSDGWFRGQVGLPRAHDQWGSQLSVLAELRVAGRTVCASGPHWRSQVSEITRADLIGGQTTDLTAELGDWLAVCVRDQLQPTLVSSPAPPVRRIEELTPVAVTPGPDSTLFDLGQNINGWVRLGHLGPAGTELTLVHGEALDAAGGLTTDHLRVELPFLPAPLPAGQVDRVISAGRPGDTFEPRHTTHGFRYVSVEGHAATPELTGIVVHTDLERTGWFHSSDERLNRLHEAAVWSLRGNVCDIPTDCPTRERAGWTGDWQLFVPTAAFLYDVAGFSTKWLRDLAAEQTDTGLVANLAPSPPHEAPGGPLGMMNGSAGWGDAAVIVPWELHRAYGDKRLLEEQWPAMVAWLEYVERSAAGGRHPERAARHPEERPHDRYLWDTGFHFGEWLEPGADLKGPDEFAAFVAADKADVATAYFARSAALLSRIAAVLGRPDEAERYRRLSAAAIDAWRNEFIDADGGIVPDTQANLVRALGFELIPEPLRARAMRRLVDLIRAAGTHLQTGFLATPELLPVLAEGGQLELAYELLLTDTAPSWLHMIESGATTLWERWDGIRPDGSPYESLNHYSKGAVIAFLHRYVGGVQLLDDAPAYRRFRIAPRPGGGLTHAHVRHDSRYGRIESEWAMDDSGMTLSVTVPPGAVADVVLPDGGQQTVGPGRHSWS